jgi:hypothetical protein
VAQDRYLLAVVLAAVNLFTLRVLLDVKRKIDSEEGPKVDSAPK